MSKLSRRAGHSAELAAVAALLCALPAALSAQQSTAAGLTGDANRGALLFADTYNCYACHGFDAQTGERRLLPMNYTQEGFITFVQSSPLPQMPAFPDMPAQALADVYAYLKAMPIDAPAVEDVPLLKGIRDAKLRALNGD